MDSVADYISELRLIGRSKSYIKHTGYILNNFTSFLASTHSPSPTITSATPDDIKAYIQSLRDRKVKDNSLLMKVGYIDRFFTFIIETKKYNITDSPTKRITKLLNHRHHQTRRPIKSVEEICTLIHGIHNPRDRAITVLFAKTGIRNGELVALNIDDIDFDNQTMNVNKHIDDVASNSIISGRKNGNESIIPLDDETVRTLKFYLTTRPDMNKGKTENDNSALFISHGNKFFVRMTVQDVSRIVKQWSIRTGIGLDSRDTDKKIVPHFFRAWNAYILQLNGCNPAVIDAIRGDVAGSIRQFYVNQVMPFEVVRKEYLRAVPMFGI